jgi:hypothetical protein
VELHPVVMRALVAVLAAAGCGKPDAGAEVKPAAAAPVAPPAPRCGPLVVTAGGAAVANLRGLAVTLQNGEYQTEQVELYDTDRVTCAEVLAPSFAFPAGAVSLRAYYHPQAQGLGTEAFTAMGIAGITLIAKAAKPGDTTSMCVPPGSTFTPTTGSFAGRPVTVSGTLAGVYCGVKDTAAR